MAKEKKSSNLKLWIATLKKFDLEAMSKGKDATVGSILDAVLDEYEHGNDKLFGLYLKLVQFPEDLPIKRAVALILRDVIAYAKAAQQDQQKKQ